MKTFFFTVATSIGTCIMLLVIFFFIQSTVKSTMSEKTAFECGFLSTDKSQKSFSISYFYLTIIFLIFDLEILIIAPLMVFKSNINSWSMLMIITIYFSMILKFEWNNNMLEWKL